jgi:hypothetical protein
MLPIRAIRRQYLLLGDHSCEVPFDLLPNWLLAQARSVLTRMLVRRRLLVVFPVQAIRR